MTRHTVSGTYNYVYTKTHLRCQVSTLVQPYHPLCCRLRPSDLHARLAMAGEIEPQDPVHPGLPAFALRLEPFHHVLVEADGDAFLAPGSGNEADINGAIVLRAFRDVAEVDLIVWNRVDRFELTALIGRKLRAFLRKHDAHEVRLFAPRRCGRFRRRLLRGSCGR